MKPLFALTLLTLCSCAPSRPTLVLLHYDPTNNRVDEQGNLVPFTNWGIGFKQGTNWVKILEAQEK